MQAFKTAKINPDIKISIAKQVKQAFDEFRTETIKDMQNKEEIRTRLVLMLTKIMINTAAYNKLTDSEKDEIILVMKQVVEDDGLVEIYLPNEEE